MTELKPLVLGIFARPGDETLYAGGTLQSALQARCTTSLAVATRGEAGRRGDPPLCSHEALSRVRSEELQSACRLLGVSRFDFLGYVDRRLDRAEPDVLAERLVRLIRELRPAILLTVHPDAGDEDHRALAGAARIAFRLAGAEGAARFRSEPAGDLEPHQPRRLLEGIAGGMPGSHAELSLGQADSVIRLDAAQLDRKRDALRAHRTQVGVIPAVAWERFERNFGAEGWRLAAKAPGASGPHPNDPFSGLDGP